MNNREFRRWCQGHANFSSTSAYYQPLLMGILNSTPDSFSDGGCYTNVDIALARVRQMVSEGADLIDIGGESSKPGASPVSVDEELQRVMPLIERIRMESDICLSIDTSRPLVMQAAVAAGAGFINDISALKDDVSLVMAARLQVPVCLMHMQGTPLNMQHLPFYEQGVVVEIANFFQKQVERAVSAGILRENLILDPGFGFGKTVRHNMQIIRHLGQFKQQQRPLLLGVSRKSTLGYLLNEPVNQRMPGGVALSAIAVLNGANIIRTHDINETKQALLVAKAVLQADNKE